MSVVNIVCVDDNKEIIWALGVFLANIEGFKIVGSLSSTNGLLATLKELKPDILVLDLDMPGKRPLGILREITRAGMQTRTVVFSGHLRRELIDQAMDAGAWGYVSKNDGEIALVEAIRSVMTGKIAWSSEARSVIAHQ